MKLPVGAKIRIDYKRVFLISEFLVSGIHCIRFAVNPVCQEQSKGGLFCNIEKFSMKRYI